MASGVSLWSESTTSLWSSGDPVDLQEEEQSLRQKGLQTHHFQVSSNFPIAGLLFASSSVQFLPPGGDSESSIARPSACLFKFDQ